MEHENNDKITASGPNSDHVAILIRWIDEQIPPLSPIYREIMLGLLPDYLHYTQKAHLSQGHDRFAHLAIANLVIFSIQEIFSLYTYDNGHTLMKAFGEYIAQTLDIH